MKVIARLACLLFAAAMMAACSKNTIKQEIASPDGTRKIVIFVRDGGATTAFSTQISILPRNSSLPDWWGNAFMSEFSDPVTARWIDSKKVEISYKNGGRITRTEPLVDEVSVSYKTR
jgi:hypothetical protein